jgi:N-acetylmuramoyl-L-alanine amidase
VLEKAMNLDMANLVRAALEAESTPNIRVHMTRTTDVFVALPARPAVAASNGADIFLSIHFNSAAPTVRGTETFTQSTAHGNVNHAEDHELAERVNGAAVGAIGGPDRNAKDHWLNLAVLRDDNLTNTAVFHPCRACLLEVEFITNPTVDQLFNTDPNHEALRRAVANAVAGAIIDDLENQP